MIPQPTKSRRSDSAQNRQWTLWGLHPPLLTIALISTCAVAVAAEPYFPMKGVSEQSGLSAFEAGWYTDCLRRLKEPSLLTQTNNSKGETYRLTIIPSFGNPVSIRVQENGGSYLLISACLTGQGGYDAGRLAERKRIRLDEADSRVVADKIRKLNLFEIPTNETPEVHGNDGEEWIIEGLRRGKYHVVRRWCLSSYQTEKRRLQPILDLTDFLLTKSRLRHWPAEILQPPLNRGQK